MPANISPPTSARLQLEGQQQKQELFLMIRGRRKSVEVGLRGVGWRGICAGKMPIVAVFILNANCLLAHITN